MRKYHTSDLHALALAYARDPYDSPPTSSRAPTACAALAPGQRLTLAPNPYFTALPPARNGSAVLPRPELRYVVLSDDEGALVRALHVPQPGVDAALGLGPASLPALRGLSAADCACGSRPSLAVEHLELNLAAPALRDLRVRQALQAAMDKRALRPRASSAAGRMPIARRDQPDPVCLAVPRRSLDAQPRSISALARRLLRAGRLCHGVSRTRPAPGA